MRRESVDCQDGKHEVLQVRQSWEGLGLEARHLRPSHGAVHIGSRLGWRWQLLGVDMGWVPEPLHRVLPFLPPIWSEVQQAPVDEFHAAEAAMTGATHRLFHHEPALGWVAEVEDHWPVVLDGRAEDAESLVARGRASRRGRVLRIPLHGTSLTIQVGGLLFESRTVQRAVRVERPAWRVDPPLALSGTMLGFAAMLLAVVVAFSPPPPQVDMLELEDFFVEVPVQEVPRPERVEPEKSEKPREKKAEREERRESKAKKRADRKEVRQAIEDRKVAESSGIFAGDALEKLGNAALPESLRAGASGLIGVKGHGFGQAAGLGSRGSLFGGGPGAEGIGSVDVFGGNGPPGDGGVPKMTKSEGTITARTGDVITMGALSASEVDRVVKQHLNALRYCYQQELNRHPQLQGKVVVGFTIAADGTVSAANTPFSSLKHPATEGCLASRFLRMRFPEPMGNGIVVVRYPFLFTQGASS